MSSRLPLLLVAGFLSIVLLGWWLWPGAREMLQPTRPASQTPRPNEPTPPAAMQRRQAAERPAATPPTAEPSPAVEVAPLNEKKLAEAPEPHGDEHAAAPSGDLELYAERPMSTVPHRVVRGWGAASDDLSRLGLVGAYVIVEPGISDAQLTRLALDIHKYHRDAKALSVRILDSEEAATYDRHIDGGALGEQHEVATVTRDPQLDVNRILVRGKVIDR